MYEKAIAQVTKDHLLTHLATYLAEVNEVDTLALVMPKTIEIASVVGGVMDDKTLPAYAIDCGTKALSETNEDLNTYQYGGQITGLIGGRTDQAVDTIIKGHKSACELFVTRHLYLTNPDLTNFRIIAMGFNSSEFSGAMQVETNPKSPYWIAGFAIMISWLVSENPAFQHE